MTDSQFNIIMDRLDRLEGAIQLQSNPSKSLAIEEKAAILKKAFATGNKAKIKEAKRFINGN